jgi:hypothetical protein
MCKEYELHSKFEWERFNMVSDVLNTESFSLKQYNVKRVHKDAIQVSNKSFLGKEKVIKNL